MAGPPHRLCNTHPINAGVDPSCCRCIQISQARSCNEKKKKRNAEVKKKKKEKNNERKGAARVKQRKKKRNDPVEFRRERKKRCKVKIALGCQEEIIGCKGQNRKTG
jgi:FKBP-type peptidyl-prolyl cis-trans isomerase